MENKDMGSLSNIEGNGSEKAIRTLFTDEKAAENFIELAKRFYSKNFGTVQKTEIDQMMFQFVYEAMCFENEHERKHEPSSLEVAMRLGITPGRVEGYLERMALRNNIFDEIDWWDVLEGILAKCKPYLAGEEVIFTLPNMYMKYQLINILDQEGYSFAGLEGNPRGIVMEGFAFISICLKAFFLSKGGDPSNEDFDELENELMSSDSLDSAKAAEVVSEIKKHFNEIDRSETHDFGPICTSLFNSLIQSGLVIDVGVGLVRALMLPGYAY